MSEEADLQTWSEQRNGILCRVEWNSAAMSEDSSFILLLECVHSHWSLPVSDGRKMSLSSTQDMWVWEANILLLVVLLLFRKFTK